MNHDAWKLCFFPCFTLVAIICVLVKCCCSWRKEVLLGGLDGGNVLVPYPYLTLSIYIPPIVLSFGMVVICIPKGSVLCSPMRRRGLNARG
jgi:hypothetical protein